MKSLITILTTLILLSSCSIQKRKYTNGYHITHKSKIQSRKKINQNQDTAIKVSLIEKINLGTVELEKIPVADKNFVAYLGKEITPKSIVKTDECDLIILKTGDEIKCKVTEITLSEIKYKKCDNLNGPTISIDKNDVFVIKYSNGTKDVINIIPKEKPENKTNQSKKVNVTSVIGFIISLLASPTFLFLSAGFGIVLFITALLLSILGLIQISQFKDKYTGKGFAIAGILITIFSILGSLVILYFI
jgi:hypothetical protein